MPVTVDEKRIFAEIVHTVRNILRNIDLERLLGEFPEKYLNRYVNAGIELDEISCFFNTSHNKLKPITSGEPGKGYAVYPDEKEDPVMIETKEKAQYIALALSRRKVRQNETIRIRIPRENPMVVSVLDDCRKELNEASQSPIAQLEQEMNEATYRLYGLDEQDKATVESFLTELNEEVCKKP